MRWTKSFGWEQKLIRCIDLGRFSRSSNLSIYLGRGRLVSQKTRLWFVCGTFHKSLVSDKVNDRSIVLMRSWVLLVLYLIRRIWTNDVRHFLLVLYQWQLGKSLNTMPIAFSWNLPSIYSSDWLYHRLFSTLKYPLSRSMGKV